MPKKVILHLGSAKTGTTAIQQFFRKNGDELKKQGFYYPIFDYKRSGVGIYRNGHFLYQLAMRKAGSNPGGKNDPKIKESYRAFKEMAKEPGEAVVLSDETFWQMVCRNEEALPELKELCDKAGYTECKIVVYLRRQDRFVESKWNQLIKSHRGNLPYSDFEKALDEYIENGPYCKYACDYDKALRRLEEIFGLENIVLRVYDRKLLKNGDTRQDFLDVLGLEMSKKFKMPPEDKNTSIKSRAFTELKRYLNMAPSYVHANNSIFSTTVSELSAEFGDEEPGGFMSPEKRREYLARYAEGNRAVAQRYFGRDELFGPESVDEQPKWEPVHGEMERDMMLIVAETAIKQQKIIDELQERLEQQEERIAVLEKAANIKKPAGTKSDNGGRLGKLLGSR